jgi:oxygen-dependent protoporphyrinogen oxidase
MKKIVVVGGGIAGLAAAYYANKTFQGTARVTLLEKADYWGGKITTHRETELVPGSSFVVEGGPDTFIVTKPWAMKLCQELGIGDRLQGTNPDTKKTYILKSDKLHELPGGLTMMIPTEIWPMIKTGLLSWPAKARMGLDFFIPAATPNGEESLGGFVSRRLGRSAYENLIEPLMSGIYAGDGDRLSLQATFPYLRDLELKYGGLVRGALKLRRERMKKAGQREPKATPGSRSIFMTPISGLAEIVEALVTNLRDSGTDMRLRQTVVSIDRSGPGYQIKLSNGEMLSADAVVLASPPFASADLIEAFMPELAAELRAIEYVSTATVSLIYNEKDLSRPLDGYGYVIPRKEKRTALACTWTSTKFPHRAPEGYALVRVFVGRAGQEEDIHWDEATLTEIAQEEVRRTLGIETAPMKAFVSIWEQAMPQYNLGHPARLERIDELLESVPGLALAGNGYRGIGLPDCIHSGELAIDQLEPAMDQIAQSELAA